MSRLLLLLILLSPLAAPAQKLFKPRPSAGETLPAWAVAMYADNPNVFAVDDGYRRWRAQFPEAKTTYTQYYKKWRRAVAPCLRPDGSVACPDAAEQRAFQQRLVALQQPPNGFQGAAAWTNIGPFETFATNAGPNPPAVSSQFNAYCFEQSLSHPDILYCGTEGGEVFKSTDRGLHWFCVSRAYEFNAPTGLEVHPGNPDVVFVGEGPRIRRSLDGGNTWELVLDVPDLGVNEILVNPAQPDIVLAATFKGLYRSTDGGATWTQLFPEACYDVEWKTDDASVAFLVRNDPNANICRFYKSADAGATWTLKDTGWFFSAAPGVNDGGARLAVTGADPNRVYAVLIGEAKTDDSGFIGIYRSDDAGESWTLPNPPAGGPWNDTDHPNMATIGRTGGYHQGFYNLGFDASDTDPDFVMAGFLNLWYSTDGAKSFTCFGGYCGNPFGYVHPDCQEIEINGADIWMMSDGGIEYSDDHFQTHSARNRGITSSDFWGFGAGWNDDVLVGGRYHNGNTAWYEAWEEGETLSLGGGEAASGYVNPGPELRSYFSDIGGVKVPPAQNGFAEYFGFGKFPNESYYDAESGEMEWDPRCWNHIYVSNQNKLWKTADGGASWTILHAFGSDENARALGFEISRSNPEVLYLFQRSADSWGTGTLWKTADGGQNWTTLPLPPGYARRVLLSLSATDENLLWLAYADGADGEKIYRSADGGQHWTNLGTPALDGEHISYILHQGGSDEGLYLGTARSVWFREAGMSDWAPYREGLPQGIFTCILRPFYRDGKLRMGAYGKGIWETPLATPSRPVAQPMVNKRETTCPSDTFLFDDYSILSHEGAGWLWEFPGGTPATSTLRNPQVVYSAPGEYDVRLTVSNPLGTSTKTVEKMVKVEQIVVNNLPVVNNFSGGLGDLTIVNPDGGITWEPVVLTTCNPAGDTAYYVQNYIYSAYGVDDLLLPVNLDLTQVQAPELQFRVAYAPYFDGNAFIDSLKVLLSDDCGNHYHTIFRSGGEALSTTTSGLGANNLYEYDAFSPASCDEWRDIALDLSAYAGKYVTLRIVNQSGYGNNMYVDDIALTGLPLTAVHAPGRQLICRIQPNPGAGEAYLQGSSERAGEVQLLLFDALGNRIASPRFEVPAGAWQYKLQTGQLPAGVYWLHVRTEEGGKVLRWVRG